MWKYDLTLYVKIHDQEHFEVQYVLELQKHI